MRQLGIVDYIASKSKQRIPFWGKRLKGFIVDNTDSALKTDEEINSASLAFLNRDHDEIHQIILSYLTSLSNEGLLPGSIHSILSALKGWLSANRYIIDNLELKEMKAVIPRNVIVTEDDYLTVEKIKQIIAQSDILLRSFILIACSSGARIGEILSLKMDSIKYWEEEDLYYFRVNSTESKNGKPHRYYISHEAYKEVSNYLKNWKQFSDLRVQRAKKSLGIEVTDSDLIYQIASSGIRKKLTLALKKAQILSKDAESNRCTIHPHSFRKFADTVFKEHLGVNMGNELIGHDEGLSPSYRRYDPKAVAEAYRKVEPFVTILAPADYVEIKNRVSEDLEKMRAAFSAQSLEIIEIKERLQETEELLSLAIGNNRK